MKAMILAAGLGTRLKPLTDSTPKALIEIQGTPMLEIVIKRLITSGVKDIIINTHHLAQKIADFLETKNNFDIHIELSYEPEILGTGGGIKNVAPFFDDGLPFIVHNVDVLSNVDLKKLYDFHLQHQALATLAVQKRSTLRPLIVDSEYRVCGRKLVEENILELARTPAKEGQELNFCGIQVISPEIFDHFKEEGSFSIISTYLRLISEGKKILGFRIENAYWKDIGNWIQLKEAEKDVMEGLL